MAKAAAKSSAKSAAKKPAAKKASPQKAPPVVAKKGAAVTGADGALYVSDDNKGFIYRVFARP